MLTARDRAGQEVVAGSRNERHRVNDLFNLSVFVFFAILWIAFGVALLSGQGGLDQAWAWLRSLPFVVQIVVALLILPVAAGLWIWETSWPLVVRLPLVIGLGAWNLYMFFPRSLFGR